MLSMLTRALLSVTDHIQVIKTGHAAGSMNSGRMIGRQLRTNITEGCHKFTVPLVADRLGLIWSESIQFDYRKIYSYFMLLKQHFAHWAGDSPAAWPERRMMVMSKGSVGHV